MPDGELGRVGELTASFPELTRVPCSGREPWSVRSCTYKTPSQLRNWALTGACRCLAMTAVPILFPSYLVIVRPRWGNATGGDFCSTPLASLIYFPARTAKAFVGFQALSTAGARLGRIASRPAPSRPRSRPARRTPRSGPVLRPPGPGGCCGWWPWYLL